MRMDDYDIMIFGPHHHHMSSNVDQTADGHVCNVALVHLSLDWLS